MFSLPINISGLSQLQKDEFARADALVHHFSPTQQTVEQCFQSVLNCFSEGTRATRKKQVRKFTKRAREFLEDNFDAALTTQELSLKRKQEGFAETPCTRKPTSIWKTSSVFFSFNASTLRTPEDVLRLWRELKTAEAEEICNGFLMENKRLGKPEPLIMAEITAFQQKAKEFAQIQELHALETMRAFSEINKDLVIGLLGKGPHNLTTQTQLVVLLPHLTPYLQSIPHENRALILARISRFLQQTWFLPYEKMPLLPLHFCVIKNFLDTDILRTTIELIGDPFLFQESESIFLDLWREKFSQIGKPMDDALIRTLYQQMNPFYRDILETISVERFRLMTQKFAPQTVIKIISSISPNTSNVVKTMNLVLFSNLINSIWPLGEQIVPPAAAYHSSVGRLTQKDLFPLKVVTQLCDKEVFTEPNRSALVAELISKQTQQMQDDETICLEKMATACYQTFLQTFLNPTLIKEILSILDEEVVQGLQRMEPDTVSSMLEIAWPQGRVTDRLSDIIAQSITDKIKPPSEPEDFEEMFVAMDQMVIAAPTEEPSAVLRKVMEGL